MLKTKVFFLSFVIVILGCLFFPPHFIQAQGKPAFGISIEPQVMYLSLQPGETQTHVINLKNDGQQPLVLTPTLLNFNPSESGQGIELEDIHTFPYLDPSQTSPFQQPITIEPGGSSSFRMPIRVPASAPTKEYHLTILFSAAPNQSVDLSGATTSVAGSIGSNLVLLVSQDDRDLSQLSIESVQGSKVIDSFGQISLRAMAKNSGPTATVASGSAVLKDWRGKSVQNYKIYPDIVLANSVRQLRVIDPESEPGETPIALDEFIYDAPFLIGPYTFELELTDANEATLASSTTQIWATPFAIIVILILGTGMVLGYLFFVKKLPIGKPLKTY